MRDLWNPGHSLEDFSIADCSTLEICWQCIQDKRAIPDSPKPIYLNGCLNECNINPPDEVLYPTPAPPTGTPNPTSDGFTASPTMAPTPTEPSVPPTPRPTMEPSQDESCPQPLERLIELTEIGDRETVEVDLAVELAEFLDVSTHRIKVLSITEKSGCRFQSNS